MALFNMDNRKVLGERLFSLCLLLQVVVILLVSTSPTTMAKLFEAPSKYTGTTEVLLDVKFTLHLSARKDGVEVSSKQLTDHDVEMVRLLEISSRNLFTLELVFTESTIESCSLAYRYLRYDSPDIIGLSKEIELNPSIMFDEVDSPLEQLKFSEPGHHQENIGDYRRPYLCNRTEIVSFKQTAEESDGYHYCVKLETRHFHTQAFEVRGGGFSPEPPTECKAPVEPDDFAIVVGTAAGSVFVLALIAVVLVLLVRQKRQQPYANLERGTN